MLFCSGEEKSWYVTAMADITVSNTPKMKHLFNIVILPFKNADPERSAPGAISPEKTIITRYKQRECARLTWTGIAHALHKFY
jgi:hypothetical protein